MIGKELSVSAVSSSSPPFSFRLTLVRLLPPVLVQSCPPQSGSPASPVLLNPVVNSKFSLYLTCQKHWTRLTTLPLICFLHVAAETLRFSSHLSVNMPQRTLVPPSQTHSCNLLHSTDGNSMGPVAQVQCESFTPLSFPYTVRKSCWFYLETTSST